MAKKYRNSIIIIVALLGSTFVFICCEDGENAKSEEEETAQKEGEDLTIEDTDSCKVEDEKIVLDEEHNYSFSNSLNILDYELKEYPNVPTIDWSNVTRDVLGHEIDAKIDIGHVALVVWNISEYELFEEWLNTDTLNMEYLETMVQLETRYLATGATSATLADFQSMGSDPDPETFFLSDGRFNNEEYIYVLLIGRSGEVGKDAITAAFLRPVPYDNAATDLMITNESITVDYSVSFNQKAYVVSSSDEDIRLDWKQMDGKKNAMGYEFDYNDVGRVMLTFYAGMTSDTLQSNFFDLEIIADRKYEYYPEYPKVIALSKLTDESGVPFDVLGEEEGTWLLSCWCTTCHNPAPKYLSVISPCI